MKIKLIDQKLRALLLLLVVFSFYNNCQKKDFFISRDTSKSQFSTLEERNYKNYFIINVNEIKNQNLSEIINNLQLHQAEDLQILPSQELVFKMSKDNYIKWNKVSLTLIKAIPLTRSILPQIVSSSSTSELHPTMPVSMFKTNEQPITLSEEDLKNKINEMIKNLRSSSKSTAIRSLRQSIEIRDSVANKNVNLVAEFPPKIDLSLSKYFPPIVNQGSFNSCVAHSMGYYAWSYTNAKKFDLDLRSKLEIKDLCNPLYVYFLGNRGKDKGMYFEDAISLLKIHGCATYKTFKENQDLSFSNPNSYLVPPPYEAFIEGTQKRFKTPSFIGSINSWGKINFIRGYLNEGALSIVRVAIASGMDHFKLNNSNGVIIDNSGPIRGYHSLVVVGYDDLKEYTDKEGLTHQGAFLLANSWGNRWGFSNSINSNINGDLGFLWVGYDLLVQKKGLDIDGYYVIDSFSMPPQGLIKAINITKKSSFTNSANALSGLYMLDASGYSNESLISIPVDLNPFLLDLPTGTFNYSDPDNLSSAQSIDLIDPTNKVQFKSIDNNTITWKNTISSASSEKLLPRINSFTVNSVNVNAGEKVLFNWTTTNATQVKASLNGQEEIDVSNYGVANGNAPSIEIDSNWNVVLTAYSSDGVPSNSVSLSINAKGSVCNIENYPGVDCTYMGSIHAGKTADGKNVWYQSICEYQSKLYRCDGGSKWTEVTGR